MAEKRYSLFELNHLVSAAIERMLPNEYWVEAEIAELRESRGHCYIELVQKEANQNTFVAKASAKCWRNTWMMLDPYFYKVTGQRLHSGLKVLLKVYPQFHEAYGFSWIVSDINPEYTIGDLARRRAEIIKQLKEMGVFDLNKQLQLPMFTQRIAVISSATAAGYGDFCNQLAMNDYGFQFTTQLFPAIMQGEQVEQSIIAALNRIAEEEENFDCVIIIRGGGATTDMTGFDTLPLAENIANFPLPIITGIGHDRDECILDMVSHTRVKTPTAAAALLIERLKAVADRIDNYMDRIVRQVSGQMEMERLRLERTINRIPLLVKQRFDTETYRLSTISSKLPSLFSIRKAREEAKIDSTMMRLSQGISRSLTEQSHKVEMLLQRAKFLDPTALLKRGYSITLLNGKALHDSSALKAGDIIETRLEKSTIKSTIL